MGEERRIEEIEEHLERMERVAEHPTHAQYSVSPKAFVRDVSYLLKRVEELERENLRWQRRSERLEREQVRLWELVNAAEKEVG